jgi:hypothetical protein
MTEKTENQTTEETPDLQTEDTDQTPEPSLVEETGTQDSQTAKSGSSAEPDFEDTEGGKVHREAAKYRTQLRETEAELDTVTGQRNQLAAQVIEHQLGNLKPNVFWKLAGDVTDYIKDDGTVNLEKVTETAKTIGDDLGINTGPLIPGQEKRPSQINTGNKLQQAFEPR